MSIQIQRYLFKVGPVDLADGTLLSGIVDLFEEGVAAGQGVLELIGGDVAASGSRAGRAPGGMICLVGGRGRPRSASGTTTTGNGSCGTARCFPVRDRPRTWPLPPGP